MLCFPALSFWFLCSELDFVEFSLDASKFLHSSSVAGCPSRTEKNLCRRIDLILSKEWDVYHPSRSCRELRIEKVRREEYIHHSFHEEHRDLQSFLSALGQRYRKAGTPQFLWKQFCRRKHASSLDEQNELALSPRWALSVYLLPVFPALEIAAMQIDIRSILSSRCDGRPGYWVVRVSEIQPLVAASCMSRALIRCLNTHNRALLSARGS